MRAVIGAVMALVVLGVCAGTASAGSECGDCTASYSGTWTVTWPFGSSGNATVTLQFAESLQSGNWSLTSASGTYTEPAQQANHYPGCSANLSLNASAAAMLGSFGPNVVAGPSGYWTAELFPPTYWGLQGDPVNSSQSVGDCATSARVDYAGLSHGLGGNECHFDASAGNTEAISFPVSSSYTDPDNCTGTVTSNGVVYNVSLQSSVTFTSPGVVSPGGSHQGTPARVKAWAQSYWRGLTAIYIDVIAQQNIQLEAMRTDLILNVQPPSGLTTQQWVKSSDFQDLLMVKGFRQVRLGFENLLALLETAYNDPPFTGSSPAPVANVTPFRFKASPCANIPPRSRRACTRLEQDAANWIDATESLEALARALATDVGREASAGNANTSASLEQAELALLPRLTAARNDQHNAGLRFGTALRSIGVDVRIPKSKTAAGIASLLAKLAHDGVTTADVRTILRGKKLVPRPLSLDNLLGA